MTQRQPIIGVMGPGAEARPVDLQMAYELGQQIAQAGWILLTGGRNCGVMEAASQGAKQGGGLTLGILPTRDLSQLSAAVDIPIFTEMGNARNTINVLSSRVVVACGIGPGTAAEIALALKVGTPVVLLNPEVTSQQFFLRLAPHQVWVAATPADAIAQIRHLLGQDTAIAPSTQVPPTLE